MATERLYLFAAAFVFGLGAVVHAARIAFRLPFQVGQRELPMALSVVGFAIGLAMCAWACWLLLLSA